MLLCHLVTSSHTRKILLLLVCEAKGLLSATLQPAFPSQLCTLPSRLLGQCFQSPWGSIFPSLFLRCYSHAASLIALHLHTPIVFLWWVVMGSDCHQRENQPFSPTFTTFCLHLLVYARDTIKFMCTQATGHAAPAPVNTCSNQR